MSFLSLYLITRVVALNEVAAIFLALSGVLSIIFLVCYAVTTADGGNNSPQRSWFKYAVISFVASAIVVVLTPTNKDVAIILGGYYVSNSEEIKQLPDNVAKTANIFLKNYIDSQNEKAKPKQ